MGIGALKSSKVKNSLFALGLVVATVAGVKAVPQALTAKSEAGVDSSSPSSTISTTQDIITTMLGQSSGSADASDDTTVPGNSNDVNSSSEHEVIINGETIPMPKNGVINKHIPASDDNGGVQIQVNNSTAGDAKNTGHSSSTVRINSSSSSRVYSNQHTTTKTTGGGQ